MHHGHDLMNRLMGVDERSSSSASSASRDVQTLCSCCSFAAAWLAAAPMPKRTSMITATSTNRGPTARSRSLQSQIRKLLQSRYQMLLTQEEERREFTPVGHEESQDLRRFFFLFFFFHFASAYSFSPRVLLLLLKTLCRNRKTKKKKQRKQWRLHLSNVRHKKKNTLWKYVLKITRKFS